MCSHTECVFICQQIKSDLDWKPHWAPDLFFNEREYVSSVGLWNILLFYYLNRQLSFGERLWICHHWQRSYDTNTSWTTLLLPQMHPERTSPTTFEHVHVGYRCIYRHDLRVHMWALRTKNNNLDLFLFFPSSWEAYFFWHVNFL